MRRDVFQAIADPTRRKIIYLLSDKELSLNEIAKNFKISRPAISKHIKILSESGLIKVKKQGREHFCRTNTEPLNEVSEWLSFFEKFWDGKLNALKKYLEEKK